MTLYAFVDNYWMFSQSNAEAFVAVKRACGWTAGFLFEEVY